ncbi:MAG: type II secretion system F family protein [Phycisphaerales bacterium]|nr:type II secretion system F family protein [Phycisphaerales bacterium]
MSTWRYKARDLCTQELHCSVIHAETAVAARAALRKAGMRPVMVRPIRSAKRAGTPIAGMLHRHMRSRRIHLKADLYDSISILLSSGVPLSDAVRTIGRSRHGKKCLAELAHSISDQVQGGRALSECMRDHPDWFDEGEVALVGAGQRMGEMGSVLSRLADRQNRSGQLSSKLIGAMTYPILVGVVGIGVAIFLSVSTLPELVGILQDAQIDPPVVTAWVMWSGQLVWANGILIAMASLVLVASIALCVRLLPTGRREQLCGILVCCVPALFRRSCTAETMLSLSELIEAGIPLVEAIRIVAPTLRGVHGGLLARSLQHAASRIEQGQPVSCLFENERWFSDEHRQLMRAGEEAGELPRSLKRIGEMDLRASRRRIDQLASLLEPVAILVLAVCIGVVVMAAILPLIRLQEIAA